MRERAAQIGAHLEVQSRPGRGTTITVSLPTEDSGAVPTAAAQPPTAQTPEAQWQK
jgi:signal transduction histidine kinase